MRRDMPENMRHHERIVMQMRQTPCRATRISSETEVERVIGRTGNEQVACFHRQTIVV